jgi:hypothetical protein
MTGAIVNGLAGLLCWIAAVGFAFGGASVHWSMFVAVPLCLYVCWRFLERADAHLSA